MVAGNTEQELYSEVIALVIARPFLSLSLNLCQDTVHLQTCQTNDLGLRHINTHHLYLS